MDPAFPILYSLPLESSRSYFSENISRAIDIGMDHSPIGGSIQSPCDPFAAKLVVSLFAFAIHGQGVEIKQTGFACIRLFGEDHANADQFCFILKHLNEASVRDLHEMLIHAFSQANLLLLQRILADDKRANPFGDQQIDQEAAGRVQIMLDAPVPSRRQLLDAPTSARTSQGLLEDCSLFIIILVTGLDATPINNDWNKARFVCALTWPDCPCQDQVQRADRDQLP
jgi:hypothetical protein